MKPLHVALLVIGAALAGGVAVKMTQPQPVPIAASTPPPSAPAIKPAPREIRPPLRAPETPTTAPPPVFVEPSPSAQPNKSIRKNKPTPFPAAAAEVKLLPPVAYVPPPAPEPKPARRHVTLQSGMTIAVRLTESLPGCAKTGETFSGSLAEPLIVDHLVIAERGARINGRCNGSSPVELQLSRLATADGQFVSVSTEPRTSNASSNEPIAFRLISPVTITEREVP